MKLAASQTHASIRRLSTPRRVLVAGHSPSCIRYRRLVIASTSSVGDSSSVRKDESPVQPVMDTTPAVDAPEQQPSKDDLKSSAVESHALDIADDQIDDMFGTKELVEELSDTSQFGKRGEAWFFALAVVMLLVVFPPMRLQGLVELLSTLAISAGVVFLVYALFSLGRNFSPFPSPRKNNTLTTTGMYGYVRHPMYAGLLLLAFGLTIFTGSETRFALSCLLWWVLEQKARLEERLLEQLHPEYSDYRSKVKKFLPYVY